ncbi:phycobiliprotein lyase [Anthocerotibacter panamensis]|uniref:phycobiliprotein lyase n=1 Tax=Anthocerotibacter panamensis TaxID=2857077 RepID=UPI001C403F05|nr:phycobiliprotein lyase [Anthocerotibacter panamensis]
MDVMDFFRTCEGRWYSQRVSHHLAFRRQEKGESEIAITCMSGDAPEVVALCELHKMDPAQALGGALVCWHGVVQGDDLNHDGRSLLVPVPDQPGAKTGALLRDLGYAEIVPVAGRYAVGADGSLALNTCYQDTESEERFWFGGENLRFRCSTLKRWGGLSMTTFCSEVRLQEGESLQNRPAGAILQERLGIPTGAELKVTSQSYSPWGG